MPLTKHSKLAKPGDLDPILKIDVCSRIHFKMAPAAEVTGDKTPLTLAVGSKNPVKIRAAKSGVGKAFPEEKYDIKVFPYSVPSGVSDQPMGDFETRKGAKARARNAAEKYKEEHGEVSWS